MHKKLGMFVVFFVLFVGLAGGCGEESFFNFFKEKQPEVTSPQAGVLPTTAPEKTVTVALYFGDPKGTSLVGVQTSLPKVEGIARATINALLKAPPAASLLPVIPPGTILKDINIKEDGTAVVDFSRELITNHKGGSTGEMLTVYAIVNTLTQFPTVKQVQILVEGEAVPTLKGHVDLTTPLVRNEALISGTF